MIAKFFGDNFYLLFKKNIFIYIFKKRFFFKFSLLTDLGENTGAFPSSPIRFPWIIDISTMCNKLRIWRLVERWTLYSQLKVTPEMSSRDLSIGSTQGVHMYIEKRHSESFKFLFLLRMGLLGSQASTKIIQLWIISYFWARFSWAKKS